MTIDCMLCLVFRLSPLYWGLVEKTVINCLLIRNTVKKCTISFIKLLQV